MTLFEHAPDCTPLFPCKACEAVSWLRAKLSQADFEELVARVSGLEVPAKKKRVYRRKGNQQPEPHMVEEMLG
jgi:hypothetical protein